MSGAIREQLHSFARISTDGFKFKLQVLDTSAGLSEVVI